MKPNIKMKKSDLLNIQITLLHKSFSKKMSYELSYLGIERYYMVLWAISQFENVSQQKLADLFRVDKATILRIINDLNKKKLLSRTRNPEDQRKYIIELTTKAQKMLPAINETIDTLTEKMTHGFSEEEKNTFSILLAKAYTNYTDMFTNLPMEELIEMREE